MRGHNEERKERQSRLLRAETFSAAGNLTGLTLALRLGKHDLAADNAFNVDTGRKVGMVRSQSNENDGIEAYFLCWG